MSLKFPYEQTSSQIFRTIKRPIALVEVWSKKFNRFLRYSMIVDTGADYTLFPFYVANDLGIDCQKECRPFLTQGIGGAEKVFLIDNLKMRIGGWERNIPTGFLNHDDIPPLLGRQRCLDSFDVLFSRFVTHLDQAGKIKIK